MSKAETKTLLNFRVPKADQKAFKAKAKKFTGGNISEWLRMAGKEYTPPVTAKG